MHYACDYRSPPLCRKFICGFLLSVLLVPLNSLAQVLEGTISWETRAVFSMGHAGLVTRVPVSVGQRVAKGDVLAEVDPTEAEAGLAAARARLAHAQAADDKARQFSQEQAELHELGASTARALAQAEQAATLSGLDLEAAKRALDAAEQRVASTVLKAPFNAWVLAVDVVAGQTLAVSHLDYPAVTLGSQALQANFNVPSARMQRVALGMPVKVTLNSGEAYDATLNSLALEPQTETGELVYGAGATFSLSPNDRLLPGTPVKVGWQE